jgi:serine phosphatase RsbU (regulator of sigma subunit)
MHELTFGHHISRPDQLLNAQRDAIVMSLNPEGADEISKDGMDCVLCNFDFKNKKVEFACANNPLLIVRNSQIIEFKPDKQPVGLHEGGKKDFTLHSSEIISGDVIYIFTDGFADQFGGEKGKKFRYNRLKEKISSIHKLPLSEQQMNFEKTFNDWKGDLEQVDDVLVIGIKIK